MMIPPQPDAIYLSHGGGPLPVLGDSGHIEMVDHLRDVAGKIDRPARIIVVSAHWEEPVATITASPHPPMIYDYYGFPEASYSLEYPAPGDAELAAHVHAVFRSNGIESRLEAERGIDHGVYIPLMIMYPEADVPVVQISLLSSLDPAAHIEMGKVLASLAGNGTLLIGSGFSFHNLKALLAPGPDVRDEGNEAFEDWLIDTCANVSIDEPERRERLNAWEQAPAARYCHPREEHLLPLHVCYGYANEPCRAHVSLRIMNKRASTLIW